MANFDAAADSPRGYGEFRHGWKIVLASMLGIGLGLSPMPFYTIGVLAPELKQAFGWTMGDIMGAITMTTLVTVIAGPTVGMLAGRIGVRRVALTSVLLFGLVFCALSLQTGSLPLFYAMFGLLALVGAGTLPITWTRTVNAWFDERKGLALGLSLMGTGLFGIFAKPYTSWLVHEFGWRGAYVGLGLLPLLIALPAGWLLFRERAPVATATGAAKVPGGLTLKQTLREWRFWVMAAAIVPVSFALGGPVPNMENILTTAGVPAEHLLSLTPLIGLSALLGRIAGGWLLDRFWAPAVGFVLLSLPAVSLLVLTKGQLGMTEAGIAIFMIGFALGIEYDLVAYLVARYFGLKAYSAIYGILYVFFALGAGFGPLLMGRDFDATGSYERALYLSSFALVASAALLLLLGRYRKFPDEKAEAFAA
ncbi:MFS transporter [Sandaracinobacteroides hominis]|uniref:MFS transporter n=1 Tax=Sandaracinobacteroides hominis TaxID=2780086 RepID=UPI0018F72471|nr:MFS transporter [Sandaracinobacteroides hominis]